jgi:hypothetical protein
MAKKLLVYLFSFFGRKSKVKQQKKFINEIKVFFNKGDLVGQTVHICCTTMIWILAKVSSKGKSFDNKISHFLA